VVRIEFSKEALAAGADLGVIATAVEIGYSIVAAALDEVATTKAAASSPEAVAPAPAISPRP